VAILISISAKIEKTLKITTGFTIKKISLKFVKLINRSFDD